LELGKHKARQHHYTMQSRAQSVEGRADVPSPKNRQRPLIASLVVMSLFEIALAIPLFAMIRQVFAGEVEWFPSGLSLEERVFSIGLFVFYSVLVVLLVPLQLHRYLCELRALKSAL
jgi:hypothetical protein